jgi:HSP20 family molecular chaperone IbpA
MDGMNGLMNEMFGYPCNLEKEKAVPETFGRMTADVKEFEDRYELDLELPGYKKEEVKVELEDGYLKISAEHSEVKEEKDDEGRYIRKERHTGKLQRNFYVGNGIKGDGIKAKFEDGVLALTVQKQTEEEKKEVISIE